MNSIMPATLAPPNSITPWTNVSLGHNSVRRRVAEMT